MKEKISLLISTYNWPEALALCLSSVFRQKVLPFEIVIADDGSSASTKQLVELHQTVSPITIRHVWQEDEGFRLTQIRNKAIAASTGTYIIQVDGDVILHPLFIADHIHMMKKGHIAIGSRSHLSSQFSEQILQSQQLPDLSSLRKHAKNTLNHWRIPWLTDLLKYRYKVNGKHKYTAKGCNMAFWKDDAIQVNGYNETMTGWGSEDEELVVRMMNAGSRKQFLKMSAIVFHIHHPIASRDQEETNIHILREAIRQQSRFCTLGIHQYL